MIGVIVNFYVELFRLSKENQEMFARFMKSIFEKAHRRNRVIITLSLSLPICMPCHASLKHMTSEERLELAAPFEWQNEKHFDELVKKFSLLAHKEYYKLVDRVIEEIFQHDELFKQAHSELLEQIREIMFDWLFDTVLTRRNYYTNRELSGDLLFSNDDDSGFSNDDDSGTEFQDTWEATMTAHSLYGGGESDDEDIPIDLMAEPLRGVVENAFARSSTQNFEAWQKNKLKHLFNITIDSIDEFSEDLITVEAIKVFLTNHFKDGYNDFISDLMGSDCTLNEELARLIFETLFAQEALETTVDNSANYQILLYILDGLHYEYDWEECEIGDALYIAHTYISTLKMASHANDLKDNIVAAIRNLFIYNASDFPAQHSEIKQRYTRAIRRRDFLTALIEWAVYCAYRKVFANSSRKALRESERHGLQTPLFSQINRKKRLQQKLHKSRTRATNHYKKVYLHESVGTVAYRDSLGQQAELDLSQHLGALKNIGHAIETLRPKGSENIFVPRLFFVVKEKGGKPVFIHVRLKVAKLALPQRPLTRRKKDGVFTDSSNKYYFSKAEEDILAGSHVQGYENDAIRSRISKKRRNPVSESTDFIHSERVLMELFRQDNSVESIVQLLDQIISSPYSTNEYEVLSVVMLAYSTNSICSFCTPTLIALMNSHGRGGFLATLAKKLINYKGKSRFSIPNHNLRLTIFVTAAINFDCQAHDLTEEGQHAHACVSKPNANHLPKSRLCRPNGTLVISQLPRKEDGYIDKFQRFFYEFVGKDVHSIKASNPTTNEYDEVVFCSGSKSWD